MSDKFSKALDLAETSPASIEDTLLVARAEQPECYSRRVHIRLKPSEYEAFISQIGRKPVSEAIRELVVAFTRSKAEDTRHQSPTS